VTESTERTERTERGECARFEAETWPWAADLAEVKSWSHQRVTALEEGLEAFLARVPVRAPVAWWNKNTAEALRARETPLDLSQGPRAWSGKWGWARYDEHRPGLYQAGQFLTDASRPRTLHVGVDLLAPEGTEVFCAVGGTVESVTEHGLPLDYGPTVIVRIEGPELPASLWVLYGHLSRQSLENVRVGQVVAAGQTIGWLGGPHENGGWPSHLHLQLSWLPPRGGDLPGVVAQEDRLAALRAFPNPGLLLN
jgi:murein DD-endopeptidase MepM/ murein hydrolase activator NlpD